MKDDYISRKAAIDAVSEWFFDTTDLRHPKEVLRCLPSAQPENKELSAWKEDFRGYIEMLNLPNDDYKGIMEYIDEVPSTQPEPLTDKEQRIFLAAMGREKKVCEEVDRNYVREPYEDSLMRVCNEIIWKVKGALWTS